MFPSSSIRSHRRARVEGENQATTYTNGNCRGCSRKGGAGLRYSRSSLRAGRRDSRLGGCRSRGSRGI